MFTMGEYLNLNTLYSFAWFVGINLTLSGLLLLVMYKYPRYAVYAYNRWLLYQTGMTRKNLKLSPSVSLAYMERGTRKSGTPTLLLVHGFSSSKENYFRILKFLPKRLHVIALDLPGHGDSSHKDKDDLSIMSFVHHIKKFSDLLDITSADMHLLGTSMGGHIAGMYAATYPKDLTSVILVCPHGIKNRCENMMTEEYERTKKFVLLPDTADDYKEMINFIVHKPIKIPQIFAEGAIQIRNAMLPIYTQVAENLQDGNNQHMLQRNIENITTPMFLIWGIEDKIIDVSCVDVIKSKLPSSLRKEILFSECGHAVLLEKPRKSASHIVEYLNSFYI